MAIRQRDVWSNPYATDSRLNGMRSGRLGWRDLQTEEDDSLEVPSGIAHAVVGGAVVWGIALLIVALWKGWI